MVPPAGKGTTRLDFQLQAREEDTFALFLSYPVFVSLAIGNCTETPAGGHGHRLAVKILSI